MHVSNLNGGLAMMQHEVFFSVVVENRLHFMNLGSKGVLFMFLAHFANEKLAEENFDIFNLCRNSINKSLKLDLASLVLCTWV
jgi:hypothetical protein